MKGRKRKTAPRIPRSDFSAVSSDTQTDRLGAQINRPARNGLRCLRFGSMSHLIHDKDELLRRSLPKPDDRHCRNRSTGIEAEVESCVDVTSDIRVGHH